MLSDIHSILSNIFISDILIQVLLFMELNKDRKYKRKNLEIKDYASENDFRQIYLHYLIFKANCEFRHAIIQVSLLLT